MTAAPSSVVAAAAAAMLTTAAVIAAAAVIAVAVVVGCASRPDPEATDHEGKRDRRGDPAYLGARYLYRLG
jgi:hypothetical protein